MFVCVKRERERERERVRERGEREERERERKRSNICRKFEAIIQNYSQIEQLKFAFQY